MPRPAEDHPKQKSCWERSTTRERVLVFVTIISIVVIVVLLFLIARKQAKKKLQFQDYIEKTCDSAVCLTESAMIAEYIKDEIEPCDNFYEFSCGQFLDDAHGDEELSLPQMVAKQAYRELVAGYAEPMKESEHEMVKFTKRLFRACINESGIENDDLNSIKEVIRELGGWPVIEGPNWNDMNFDWIKATYKLRHRGYPFSIFLALTVRQHNSSKYLLKVETPDLWDYSTRHFDKILLMSEVAERFGSRDKSRALKDMTDAHDFLIRLQTEIHNTYSFGEPKEYTVEKYQKMCPSLKWVEFIQNIIGSTVNISKNYTLLFPPPQTLNSWFDVISKTPKRTQANYLIWKVIETILPYLTQDLRTYGVGYKSQRSREDFCITEIQERFIPSPIDIMCDRKYLPSDTKDKLEEITTNITLEFYDNVKNIEWVDEDEKQKILGQINNIKFVIGQPEDYFNDRILDNLNLDMIEMKNPTFLNLLAAADRNHHTMVFSQIEKAPTQYLHDKWFLKSAAGLPIYDEEYNVLYVPTTGIQFLFNKNRPNYLNYGVLGSQVGHLLSIIIAKYLTSKQKTKKVDKKIECLKSLMGGDLKSELFVQQSIGGEIAYRAYLRWEKSNGEEKELIGCKYNTRQLFWIAQAQLYCTPFPVYGQHVSQLPLSNATNLAISNSGDFAKDFSCSGRSSKNPKASCKLI